MRTLLNQANLIPGQEPYTGLGYTFVGGGGEQMTLAATQNPDIVDWILVEFRDQNRPDSVIYSRAGLLLKDGSIVDVDGQSGIEVPLTATTPYYVAIIHRNHLGVMTANPIAPLAVIDFSDPQLVIYGNNTARVVKTEQPCCTPVMRITTARCKTPTMCSSGSLRPEPPAISRRITTSTVRCKTATACTSG
ncbi:MAG: hypothetical protein R3B47_09270 [Bacteroidia bacterium]